MLWGFCSLVKHTIKPQHIGPSAEVRKNLQNLARKASKEQTESQGQQTGCESVLKGVGRTERSSQGCLFIWERQTPSYKQMWRLLAVKLVHTSPWIQGAPHWQGACCQWGIVEDKSMELQWGESWASNQTSWRKIQAEVFSVSSTARTPLCLSWIWEQRSPHTSLHEATNAAANPGL